MGNVICSKCDTVFHLQPFANSWTCRECGAITDKYGKSVTEHIYSGSMTTRMARPPRR